MNLNTTLDSVQLIDSFDQKHLWHPYTSALDPLPAFKVEGAHERTLVLADGTELLDAMSSWWCCVHGYNLPQINEALKHQVDKFAHVMFAGLTHQPAIDLGKRLLSLVPSNLQHIFYADSGSVATEVAMKMAIQYQIAQGQPHKTCFVTIRAGYHGDTWNAMSVCDPTGMHTMFGQDLPFRYFAENPHTPFPGSIISADTINTAEVTNVADADHTTNATNTADAANAANNHQATMQQKLDETGKAEDKAQVPESMSQDLASLKQILDEHHDKIAAFILEPIVQGAGGMYFYHPEFLNQAKTLCEKYDVLLILDEIATGFGRTGKLFATNHTKITPDIMLLGKGLTAGYMTLSAVLCSGQVASAISKAAPHVFMHGPTFMANPLACAVACASIDYLLSYDYQAQAKMIEQAFKRGLQAVANFKCVKQVRACGAIGVIEMHERINVKAVEQACLSLGVWLRPMGNLLYAMPPLTTTAQEIEQMINAMVVIASGIEHHQLSNA